MPTEDQPRIVEALEELSGYRDDGEEPIDNLELVAGFHDVPLAKLREMAEAKWGAPLESDRIRNAAHYQTAAERLHVRAAAFARRTSVLKEATYAALDVWNNCCPTGKPDWDYCAKRFLTRTKINEPNLRAEVTDLFKNVGSDFEKAVSLYNKWVRN